MVREAESPCELTVFLPASVPRSLDPVGPYSAHAPIGAAAFRPPSARPGSPGGRTIPFFFLVAHLLLSKGLAALHASGTNGGSKVSVKLPSVSGQATVRAGRGNGRQLRHRRGGSSDGVGHHANARPNRIGEIAKTIHISSSH